MDTLKDNPGYRIEYYDDVMCRNFIKKNFNKDILDAFDNLIPGSYKADLFRYCILYKNGGIWSDLSQKFFVPFKVIINHANDKLVLVKDISWDRIFHLKYGIQISFMAAIPKMSVYKLAIEEISKNVKKKIYGYTPLDPTGPLLFRDCLDKTDVKYRLEIEYKGEYAKFIKNNKKIYRRKLKNHSSFIKQNIFNRYTTLWFIRQIYK